METNSTLEAVDALTSHQLAERAEIITATLDALPPASGTYDAGLRQRFAEAVEGLTTA